jgi:hypothetical protein
MEQKLKMAEEDTKRLQSDLVKEKDSFYGKIQEREDERIKAKTENAILTEKLMLTRTELDELRVRVSSEINDKITELETTNRVLQEKNQELKLAST